MTMAAWGSARSVATGLATVFSRRRLVVAGGILLGLALILIVWPRGPAANHITQAQLLQYNGDSYTPPSRTVDPAALPGQWRTISLPWQPLPAFLTGSDPLVPDAGRLTTTWFRFAAPPAEALRKPLYLYIPRWKTDGQIAIYVNGRLTYQSHANDQWNGSNKPLWVALEETIEADTPREILVRMQHVTGIGGSMSSVWLASNRDISAMYLVRDFFVVNLPYMSSVAFLATGLFTLSVWLGGRREPTYILFFLMSVAAMIRSLQTYVGTDRLPISDDLFGWLTSHAVFWCLALLHLFVGQLHKRPQRWLTRVTLAVVFVCAVVTFPSAYLLDPTLSAPLLYLCILSVATVICFAGLRNSWKAESRLGLWLSAVGIIAILAGAHDWLLQNNLVNIERPFVSFYPFLAINVLIAISMLQSYITALSASEHAGRNLAVKIAQREQELELSYARLREVEEREVLSRERQRMMQDMHDGMGSSLVTALRAAEYGKLAEQDIVQLLKDCIDDLKLTIDSLEPVETDLLLLVATLRFRLQPRLESTGIGLVWQVEEIPPLTWLDQRNCLHILRILQESITNIIKHARASTIVMTTRPEGDFVTITVTDDGAGFDVDKATGVGKGLTNQMRRAEAIGGRVDWSSDATGSRFRLSLPVTRPARGERSPGGSA